MRNKSNRKTNKNNAIKFLIVSFLISTILVVGVIIGSNFVNAEASVQNEPSKYYKSITISYGDTLWDIAEDNMDITQYSTINDYISEVKSINNIVSNDIQSGEKIIIPYFVYE